MAQRLFTSTSQGSEGIDWSQWHATVAYQLYLVQGKFSRTLAACALEVYTFLEKGVLMLGVELGSYWNRII